MGTELLARILLAFDVEKLEKVRSSTMMERRLADPFVALCLVLVPFVPSFRRTLCDGASTGRDACWSSYDTHTKDAAKLIMETDWPKAARETRWSMQYHLKRFWKVHGSRCYAKLESYVLRKCGGPSPPPAPEDSASGISRSQVLEMLSEACRVQGIAQEKISILAREVSAGEEGQRSLTFLEAHKKVLTLDLPQDPMEARGISEADLPALFAEYENDSIVMNAAGQLLSPMSRGDLKAAQKISMEQLVEIHQLMESRMQSILDEFRHLSALARAEMPRKERENTAELLISSAVERQFAVRCEDVEMAVMIQEEALQHNTEFARCTEALATLVQSLTEVPLG